MQDLFENVSLAAFLTPSTRLTLTDAEEVSIASNNPWNLTKRKSPTSSFSRVGKRPSLEKTFNTPNRISPIPTNTHPLNHERNTSVTTQKKFSTGSKDYEARTNLRQRRGFSSLGNESDYNLSLKERGPNRFPSIRNRDSLLNINVNTFDEPHFSKSSKTSKEQRREHESRTVIVHVVKSSDTLVGIALFYGIEISALQKANKLWTSDSIHMHKYLYVPLDECKLDNAEDTVLFEDDRIHIAKHRSSASESSRPSVSSISSSPSTPFTFYDRELLSSLSDLNIFENHGRKMSNVSTATIWSTSSLASSSSSPTSNISQSISNVATFTSADLQELPAAQLSFFPPHRTNIDSKKSNSPLFKNPSIITPSPRPISLYQKNRPNNGVSFPLPLATTHTQPRIVDKILSKLEIVGDKYLKRGFGSIGIGIGRKIQGSVVDGFWRETRYDSTELLVGTFKKNDDLNLGGSGTSIPQGDDLAWPAF